MSAWDALAVLLAAGVGAVIGSALLEPIGEALARRRARKMRAYWRWQAGEKPPVGARAHTRHGYSFIRTSWPGPRCWAALHRDSCGIPDLDWPDVARIHGGWVPGHSTPMTERARW